MMTLTEMMRLPAPDRAANLELIDQYTHHELPIEVIAVVDRMIAENKQFRDDVLPVMVLNGLPIRLGEIFCDEARDESPWRFKRRVKKYLRLHRTDPYQQREWNEVFKEANAPSIPVDRIRDRLRPVLLAVVRVFVAMFVFALVVVGIVAYPRVRNFRGATADAKAGRAITPGSAFLGTTVYEAGTTARRVELYSAVVTLSPGSRLMQPLPNQVGAIDGDADIVVPKRPTGITAGDVGILLYKGRYRVSHPVGGATRIVIDTGMVWPNYTWKFWSDGIRYRTGAVVTAVAHDTLTTITAVKRDGSALPALTVRNHALFYAIGADKKPKR